MSRRKLTQKEKKQIQSLIREYKLIQNRIKNNAKVISKVEFEKIKIYSDMNNLKAREDELYALLDKDFPGIKNNPKLLEQLLNEV